MGRHSINKWMVACFTRCEETPYAAQAQVVGGVRRTCCVTNSYVTMYTVNKTINHEDGLLTTSFFVLQKLKSEQVSYLYDINTQNTLIYLFDFD